MLGALDAPAPPAKRKKKRVRRRFARSGVTHNADGVKVYIGLRVRSLGNEGQLHWGEIKRHKKKFFEAVAGEQVPLLVREIVFTRWAPGVLDNDDNLNSSFKAIRDAAVKWLGYKNDGPSCGLKFRYEQYKTYSPAKGVKAEYAVTVVFR
jgi:hypothetical protein